MIKLEHGDCLKLMKKIPNKSIDLILADLPYGITRAKWDSVIPLKPLWKQYKRIIKDHGCIALFGDEPFSSNLRMSNLHMYKYDWIWKKTRPTQFLNAHRRPLADYENIMIFQKHLTTYNPQMRKGKPYKCTNKGFGTLYDTDSFKSVKTVNKGNRFPVNVIQFGNGKKKYHPTEKPTSLLRYLIKTYTNKNDLILDNTMGSGSTGVAAKQLHRNFIGMEINDRYFNIAKKRINKVSSRKLISE